MLPTTTLEQWFVLQAVVEEGSFAKAAERLNRSQSSVSYALNVLQERLCVELLKIVGRKAVLTQAGQAMLAQAQPLLASFNQLELRAHYLQAGARTRVSLIVDSVFPKDKLFSAFKIFQHQFPQTQVHVAEILRMESEQSLAQQEADLYITPLQPDAVAVGDFLLEVSFIAVAHRDHPLHGLGSLLSTAQLAQFPLVSITDRASQRREMQRISSMASWSFTTVEAAIEAVCHGVGYGWLPELRIRSLLDAGELKRLPVAIQPVRKTPQYLFFGNETLRYDPTVQALAKIIRGIRSGS